MPIEIQCRECSRKFRVAEKYAGKRVKCPKCQGLIEIPAAVEPASPTPVEQEKAPRQEKVSADDGKKSAPEPVAPVVSTTAQWYLQTEEGEQYGPVSKEEMDAWVAEGRIDASCQVLRDDWKQWTWAQEVFSQLDAAASQPQTATAAVQENPFVGLDEPTQTSPQLDLGQPPPLPERGPSPATSGDQQTITSGARRALAQTKPWVTFLSILGWVFGGLGALGSLGMFVLMVLGGGLPGMIMGLAGLVGPAITLLLTYYLFCYGRRIDAYLRSDKPDDLEAALVAQKSFWKLAGIVTAVALAFYLLMIVVMMVLIGQGAAVLRGFGSMTPPG